MLSTCRQGDESDVGVRLGGSAAADLPGARGVWLGYTAASTSGAGSGARYARQIADGIAVAIARGLTVPEHIEEIGILNEGIGADRISDAVCKVLKHHFIEYTQEVMQPRHRRGAAPRTQCLRVDRARPLAD